MRSIAGVNLRKYSGEYYVPLRDKMHRKISPTHRSRVDVYPEPHFRKTFPETFSETPRPPPAGRPRGMKSPYRVGSGAPRLALIRRCNLLPCHVFQDHKLHFS